MDIVQISKAIWPAVKFIISGAVGAAVIALINHYMQKHDKRLQLENDIYALCCKFFFISSIQYSELIVVVK